VINLADSGVGAAGTKHVGANVAAPVISGPDGERRHLTVLFCDLVGSTEIAARLDPEEWRETVAGYHRAAAEEITRFGGHVAKYLGDGVMALFGYPEAHDNDAERAVRAAIAILDAVSKLQAPVRLSARVGVDSGPVVVGAGAGNEVDVFGDVPNIAARVQSAAEPGTLLITSNTQRLVSGLFVVEDRAQQALKGVESPPRLYRVDRPSGMRGRLEAAAARGLTPFIGREDELRTLTNRWERVREGDGQVALIIGEAGIGKSRLVHRFHETLINQPFMWIDAAAGALFQNSPFYPVTEILRQALFAGDSGTSDAIVQMAGALRHAGVDPGSAVPLLAPLLNLSLPRDYPPSTLTPEQQRRRLLALLVEWILGTAGQQPLIIAVEDLHWADPSTLELLQLLVDQGNDVPLLILFTARPEFHPPWPLRAHHGQITLNRLGIRDIRAMVSQVAARKALTDETIAAVIERTGGVPLFVEELTRAVLESGEARLAGRSIPATLHDSLMARLDKLGSARETLQTGAVLGSEFSYELLQAVHKLEDNELQRRLRTLTDTDFLYVRGIAPEASYQFRHALIRDAAYEALLKSRRKELHRLVADTIDSRFPAIKETHPEVLAHHWTEAGEIEPAIAAWKMAAERSVGQRSYREAEKHYRDAIALLLTQEGSEERDGRELNLQLALGGVMVATRGWSGEECAAAYARAKSLAERTGGSEAFSVFSGLCSVATGRGEIRTALLLADQALEIASQLKSRQALSLAHFHQALNRFYLGEFVAARTHLIQATENYSEADFRGVFLDPGLYSLSWIPFVNWFLGYPDQAFRHRLDAWVMAQRLNEPFALAYAATMITATDSVSRNLVDELFYAEKVEQLGRELGFPHLAGLGKIYLGWARAYVGDINGTIDAIHSGLTEYVKAQGYVAMIHNLSLLAETQALTGKIDDALVTIDQALAAGRDELWYRPLALTLRGHLRLKNEPADKSQRELAELDFRDAIELSRKMSAKSPELRATTSLARLLRDASRDHEARMMLAEIYGWFTEGFNTADLKDAKSLLDELRT
jgi:class 3 adenylate cyclase/tetratricopeptide (TPR) repeat protein